MLWALLALTAQLLPAIHAITVRHEICEVHGDIVEAQGYAHGPRSLNPARATRANGPTSSASRATEPEWLAGDEEGAHEHCDLLGVVARAPSARTTTSVVPLTVAFAVPACLAPTFTPPPIPLARLAPKLPPPSIA